MKIKLHFQKNLFYIPDDGWRVQICPACGDSAELHTTARVSAANGRGPDGTDTTDGERLESQDEPVHTGGSPGPGGK